MSDLLAVALDSMRIAAAKWSEGATNLKAGVATTWKLEIASTEAGTFAEALAKYQPAPAYFRDRLSEGVVVFQDIATVLTEARTTYEAEDLTNKGKLVRLEGEM
ncbi:hypothetical protein NN3_07550 [Nocardia neocaledoniensis NBRC 108232]|uniref:Excreted virulence factor EspC (Type VII ESX diderm) n=1 Tax=Nocardia neocaledoniensis TaxID=236511 RepID=A0A317NFU8_9NOCA|nr:hypothetical protein [Nocardia neocaledoniensis]PWV73763.1 hypothetical protein DFR69_107394 [Nocardia neocaledoniensis]GEM29748.1 hypothetical protein NN3_07550 [Nocardia neocaledoniensis NBRC 108232]